MSPPPGSAASAARSGSSPWWPARCSRRSAARSVATALAMGTILMPAMIERGYPRSFALGVVGASGTIGIVIPPSLALILYGIVAEQSVPRLFLAGILPGLLQAAAFFVWVLYDARRRKFPVEPALPLRRAAARDTGARCRRWSVPLVVMVGIYGGFVTVTEAAALSAVVALLVSPVLLSRLPLDRNAVGDRRRPAQRRQHHADRRDRAGLRPLDDRVRRARAAGQIRARPTISRPGSSCWPSTCCCWCSAASSK